MILVAVDPGMTTGIADYDTASGLVLGSAETTEPIDVAEHLDWLRDLRESDNESVMVLVESFVGAGPRTTEASHTLQVIGFARWYAETFDLPVTLQAPQQRLPYVTRASDLLPNRRHASAALAHCLAFAHKRGL